jgi:hypothetical protein
MMEKGIACSGPATSVWAKVKDVGNQIEFGSNVNSVYFACQKCRVMVDAGYRWAYWRLEHAGIVRPGAPVSAQEVFSATSYWSPPDESTWLIDEILPAVRSFLEEHGEHLLTYGDEEEIVGLDPVAIFGWLEVGQVTPRYLADVLGLRSWAEVLAWSERATSKPWWWSVPELQDAARRKFEELAGGT